MAKNGICLFYNISLSRVIGSMLCYVFLKTRIVGHINCKKILKFNVLRIFLINNFNQNPKIG